MTESTSRPRMEGAREREVLLGTLDLLAEVGYDRLTLDAEGAKLVGGLATAVYRDPEVHEAIRQKVADIGTTHLRALLQRAAERGQLRPDVDIDLISNVVPAMAFFRLVFETPGKIDPDFVRRLVEHVIVPAVTPSEDPA